MRLRARHYATGQLVEIVWDNGSIRALSPPSGQSPDVEAGWVAPALFDLPFQVVLQFLIEFLFDASAAEQGTETQSKLVRPS